MLSRLATAGLLFIVLSLGIPAGLGAQAAPVPLPTWHSALPPDILPLAEGAEAGPLLSFEPASQTRSHTLKGLLIGGLVGGVAAAVFLSRFCADADTQCGADEVGRAVLIIAVPAAVTGALFGTLIRTKR